MVAVVQINLAQRGTATMGLTSWLDLAKVTIGDLCRLADHARSAGVDEDQHLTVETTDATGNPLAAPVLVADLGDADELTRPVQIERDDAQNYFTALTNQLLGRADKTDRETLYRLADDLAEVPYGRTQAKHRSSDVN